MALPISLCGLGLSQLVPPPNPLSPPLPSQVVWFHVERNMLLTIHTKIVTRINRFRVIQDDGERWTLEIREVAQEDRGAYACQVNTEPQLREIGYLDVVGKSKSRSEG